MAMLENHMFGYLAVKEHQERLLAEGRRIHLARAVARSRSRGIRFTATRLGVRLEAFGRRLQGLDGCTPVARH